MRRLQVHGGDQAHGLRCTVHPVNHYLRRDP
jgi:hypothetical protein